MKGIQQIAKQRNANIFEYTSRRILKLSQKYFKKKLKFRLTLSKVVKLTSNALLKNIQSSPTVESAAAQLFVLYHSKLSSWLHTSINFKIAKKTASNYKT